MSDIMNSYTNGQKNNTITTMEIAEMLDVEHSKIIRKLKGSKDRKGFVQILTEAQMGVSDYFIPTTYRDASGNQTMLLGYKTWM